MRRISLIALSTLVFLVHCFAQDSPVKPGLVRGEVVTKNQNGEPAVLPHARIVLHGPISKDAESDAQGAFAIGGLPPGKYDIEASAPGLNATRSVEVMSGTTSVVPLELNVATVASTVNVTASDPPPIEESHRRTRSAKRPWKTRPIKTKKSTAYFL